MLLKNKIKEYLNIEEDITRKYSLISRANFKSGTPNIQIDKWEFTQDKPIFTEVDIAQALFEQKKESLCTKTSELCSEAIYDNYSAHKQINIVGRIDGFNDNDFNIMNTFITERIENCRRIKESINACNISEELDLIIINFEV